MANPFNKRPLPPFIEQGGERVTNVGQMLAHLLCILSSGQVHAWNIVHPPFSHGFYLWLEFFMTTCHKEWFS